MRIKIFRYEIKYFQLFSKKFVDFTKLICYLHLKKLEVNLEKNLLLIQFLFAISSLQIFSKSFC